VARHFERTALRGRARPPGRLAVRHPSPGTFCQPATLQAHIVHGQPVKMVGRDGGKAKPLKQKKPGEKNLSEVRGAATRSGRCWWWAPLDDERDLLSFCSCERVGVVPWAWCREVVGPHFAGTAGGRSGALFQACGWCGGTALASVEVAVLYAREPFVPACFAYFSMYGLAEAGVGISCLLSMVCTSASSVA